MPGLKLLTAALCALLLSACTALSPYSSVTKLNLRLAADAQLNPDLNGRPSPVVLRLLELKHPVAFENADFFSLYERADSVLKADLVAVEELELEPGKHLDLKLRVQEGSHYVGVLAAYRDLPESRWRYVIAVTPEGITHAALTLGDSGIQLDTSPDALNEKQP